MSHPSELAGAASAPVAAATHAAEALPGIVASVLLEPQVTPAPPEAPAAAEQPHTSSTPDPPPKALVDFMLQGWAPAEGALPAPIEHVEAFRARRRAVSAQYPGETIVVPSGHPKVRSNDTHYRFRPSSDFYYLSGDLEPDCVLVLEPDPSGGHRDILFTEPNPGRSDETFFTDRHKGAFWVGARMGVAESRARFGIDEARSLDDLLKYLQAVAEGGRARRVLRGFSPKVDDALAPADGDKALATFLSELRMRKDAVEIAELRAVVASTRRGFEDVIRRLPHATSEREVEGVFGVRARVEGNDVGYGTIAAAGPRACVLHYTRNNGRIEKGELLLLDAGVEGNALYTADITRTLPISGRFSPEQRAVYTLVHRAQQAAIAEVKPGNDFMEPNKAAMRVLAEGLVALGVLTVDAALALQEDQQLYKRYALHNVSHMLGLDVHDCAEARKQVYKLGKLQPGMVLTVEPGLYFQEDDLTVPPPLRGIGVRIEDDLLVTEDGHENLSAAIPSEAGEVEAWMASLWGGPRPA